MTREQSIPLFLWVATAILAHAIFGGGADQVSAVISEKMDIRGFAQAVRYRAQGHSVATEVSFDEVVVEAERPAEKESEQEPEEPEEEEETDPDPEDEPKPERVEPKKEAPKPTSVEPPPQEAEKPKETKPVPELPKAAEKPPELVVIPSGKVAIVQHVEDKNQKDNPDAAHLAEEANRVEEETRARLSSTDQDEKETSPGQSFLGEIPEPGNSERNRLAQSAETQGNPDLVPESSAGPKATAEKSVAPASNGRPAASPSGPTTPEKATASLERREAQAASPEVLASEQGQSSLGFGPPKSEVKAQKPRKRLPPPQKKPGPLDLLGLGSTGRTASGISLNLDPSSAVQVIGADRLAHDHRERGQKRLAEHRGAFQSLGIERWKSALENYVASVKEGNQTALNAARSPFASYLNQIHSRIHPIFADRFLSHLDTLPPSHPLNQQGISTHLEIQLSGQDGRVLRLGVTKSSGVTGFDVGALDSVHRAGPYGTPPSAILSSDGNVYLHWEFHRRHEQACSTYFARPFLLKLGPEPSQPLPDEAPAPTRDEGKTGFFLWPNSGTPPLTNTRVSATRTL